MLGSCVQIRYAENPRRLTDFFIFNLIASRIQSDRGATRNSSSGFRCGSRALSLDPGRRIRPRRRLRLNQSPSFTVVIEYLGVAAPVHRSLELALHLVFSKMFIENVMKELVCDRVIRLAFQHAVNLFQDGHMVDRKSTRLNSSHVKISYAVFCLKKKK